jgi:hypothetical protein
MPLPQPGRAGFREPHAESGDDTAMLEHDPEKWIPVFRKDHAQTREWSRNALASQAQPRDVRV